MNEALTGGGDHATTDGSAASVVSRVLPVVAHTGHCRLVDLSDVANVTDISGVADRAVADVLVLLVVVRVHAVVIRRRNVAALVVLLTRREFRIRSDAVDASRRVHQERAHRCVRLTTR